VEVHGEYGRGPRPYRRARSIGVDQAGARIYVAEHGCGPHMRHCECRGDERMAWHDHIVTGTDSVCAKHQHQRRRSGSDANAVRYLAVVRELLLEPLDLGAECERARSKEASKRRLQFLLHALMLALKRHEGDGGGAPMRTHCVAMKSCPSLSLPRERMSSLGSRRNRTPRPWIVQ
jgi:hypothetical protein